MDVVAEQEDPAERALGDELADLGGGGLVVLGTADELEQQRGVLARDADGEPAHEAEVDVVADLEAEVGRVEVERLVLVEDGHAADVE